MCNILVNFSALPYSQPQITSFKIDVEITATLRKNNKVLFFTWEILSLNVQKSAIATLLRIGGKIQKYLLVRFDSQMYPGVLREVTRIGKGLITLGTFVRLGLPHVDLCV